MIGIGRLLSLMQLGAEVIKILLRFDDLLAESFNTHIQLMQRGRESRWDVDPR